MTKRRQIKELNKQLEDYGIRLANSEKTNVNLARLRQINFESNFTANRIHIVKFYRDLSEQQNSSILTLVANMNLINVDDIITQVYRHGIIGVVKNSLGMYEIVRPQIESKRMLSTIASVTVYQDYPSPYIDFTKKYVVGVDIVLLYDTVDGSSRQSLIEPMISSLTELHMQILQTAAVNKAKYILNSETQDSIGNESRLSEYVENSDIIMSVDNAVVPQKMFENPTAYNAQIEFKFVDKMRTTMLGLAVPDLTRNGVPSPDSSADSINFYRYRSWLRNADNLAKCFGLHLSVARTGFETRGQQ